MEKEQEKIISEELKKVLDSGRVISTDNQAKLNDLVKDVEAIIKLRNLNEKEVDTQFGIAKGLLMEYGRTLGSFTYNLLITKDEYSFIKKQIMEKLTYERQDVFVGKKVRDSFINNETNSQQTDDGYLYKLQIEEVTWLSYLTGKFQITGLHQGDIFVSIVEKLGEVSKVFEVFQSKGTEISERFHNWLNGFEEEPVNNPMTGVEGGGASEEKTLVSKTKRTKE
jgi:hypothetical protein